jgi:hypothetical protein
MSLGVPLVMIFTLVALEPAHNNCHGPTQKMLDTPGLDSYE